MEYLRLKIGRKNIRYCCRCKIKIIMHTSRFKYFFTWRDKEGQISKTAGEDADLGREISSVPSGL